MPSVGFVGAGRLGLPMALNLLKAGFDLTVVDRRSEVEAQVRPAGAAWSTSIAEMAERVGVIITMRHVAQIRMSVDERGVATRQGRASNAALITSTRNQPVTAPWCW
jgi:3-hydroxyisobutyrate dehydrogenase-like beta-hydroxyacid dehydrogenase